MKTQRAKLADESYYMTDDLTIDDLIKKKIRNGRKTYILPLNRHIHIEVVFVFDQIANLWVDRLERRIFLHALTNNTPLVKHWKRIKDRYQLPTLTDVLLGNQIITYNEWKRLIRCMIFKQHYAALEDAVTRKSPAIKFLDRKNSMGQEQPSHAWSNSMPASNVDRFFLHTVASLSSNTGKR